MCVLLSHYANPHFQKAVYIPLASHHGRLDGLGCASSGCRDCLEPLLSHESSLKTAVLMIQDTRLLQVYLFPGSNKWLIQKECEDWKLPLCTPGLDFLICEVEERTHTS